jgi:hypothetical protein
MSKDKSDNSKANADHKANQANPNNVAHDKVHGNRGKQLNPNNK